MRLLQPARSFVVIAAWLCIAAVMLVGLTACTSADDASDQASRSAASTDAGRPSGSAGSGTTAPQPSPSTTPSTSARTSLSAKSATPVPQPVKGDVHSTIPARRVVTRPAVALDRPAHFSPTLTARLTGIRAIQATGRGPGEISGPALQLTVRIDNGTGRTIQLSNVVVNVTDAVGSPGLPIAAPPARPFTGSLAPGRSADGIYVFTVPVEHRHPVSITVSYSATAPVVLFRGSAA